ncbi:MarR family winged helix-turn-helix transcriptional regulator [Saccharospirillum impatiens]|uniref:MarR family winged helix-turn-helix transcriptional regulator n=1 Tax=Saccharospirillum impatiens TaxID=169438 RepID=UPI00040707F3|nr:MarR family winged helix-turn-helix transcriptional regulator [Saccharospirillum impatiens]
MPVPNPGHSFDLNQFLPYRLNRLADQLSEQLAHLYESSYSLNIAQWRVLAWLNQHEVLTAKQIREATRMDKARVSRAVQVLVERELISRSPNQEDQRAHHLRLTAAGRALLDQLLPQARDWEASVLSSLTDKERELLLQAMAKLERALGHEGMATSAMR